MTMKIAMFALLAMTAACADAEYDGLDDSCESCDVTGHQELVKTPYSLTFCDARDSIISCSRRGYQEEPFGAESRISPSATLRIKASAVSVSEELSLVAWSAEDYYLPATMDLSEQNWVENSKVTFVFEGSFTIWQHKNSHDGNQGVARVDYVIEQEAFCADEGCITTEEIKRGVPIPAPVSIWQLGFASADPIANGNLTISLELPGTDKAVDFQLNVGTGPQVIEVPVLDGQLPKVNGKEIANPGYFVVNEDSSFRPMLPSDSKI